MALKLTFRPLLPEIEVEELDLQGLDRLAWLLREERESFQGLTIPPMQITKLRGKEIVAISRDPRTPDEVVAKIGDFFLESQNGARFISSKSEVIWGNFQSVPAELLVPCGGEHILPPTQL